ncbi:MAG: superoxide dismutase family protein [Salinisphaeraceae bacterium]|nr:superoxide dismutase family protein [Salinisphaeraceae bacterium]
MAINYSDSTAREEIAMPEKYQENSAFSVGSDKSYGHYELLLCLLVAALLLLTGCDSEPAPVRNMEAIDTMANEQAEVIEQAPGLVVSLSPTRGHEATGTVVLTESPGAGLNMEISLSGLKPGLHGFHVHETGDCSGPEAMTAGGHFNPGNKSHGAPSEEDRHAGDLGNLDADGMGNARASISTAELSLSGPNSIRGRAFVVHAEADDLESEPSGNAGARVACGVVPGG